MEGIVWNKPETNSLHAYMAARNEAIINLRVLAVLIVVIGHCIAMMKIVPYNTIFVLCYRDANITTT